MDHLLGSATIGETADAAGNVCKAIDKAALADNFLTSECGGVKAKGGRNDNRYWHSEGQRTDPGT
jgi:hypothetical protein